MLSLEALANDKVILKRMNDVYSKFRAYMDVEPDKNVLPLLISAWKVWFEPYLRYIQVVWAFLPATT